MKKRLLMPLAFAGIGLAQYAHAQGSIIRLIVAGANIGVNAATSPKKQPETVVPAAATVTTSAQVAATFGKLALQRTPAGQRPARGAEAIAALEAQLDLCKQAYLADSTGVICPPAQRSALQQASLGISQANAEWDLQAYQHEASFYIGEDTRRQLVRSGVRVVVPESAQPKPVPASPPRPPAPVATAAEVATRFGQLQRQRTLPAALPARGAEAVTDLEAQLERCQQAYLADSTGLICSPAQRLALQQAAARLVQANAGWSSQAYQREAGFYLGEDSRRHLVSSGVPVGTRVRQPASAAPAPAVAPAAVPR